MISIRPITANDFEDWLPLWEGYNTFYKRSPALEVTETTWGRFLDPNEPINALIAEENGKILGFTHYIFHRNTALIGYSCYLQDLFTLESARGRGVGTLLIEAVTEKAKENGGKSIYWMTHETNTTAQRLYDKVAEYSGFIVYRKLVAK